MLLILVLAYSIHRDLQIESHFPADLRNRVVGSRLQHDGKLPYSYVWQPNDGLRYFDIRNTNISENRYNNITASPFFHQLFYPLFQFPQRMVSGIWLALQYTFLFGLIILFCKQTQVSNTRWMIAYISVLFTLTEAWKVLIEYGQLYFFVAFLIGTIICLLLNPNKQSQIVAGLLTAAFVLTRPIGIILFFPFLFFFRSWSWFLTTAFSALGLYLLFVITSPFERSLYRNYFSRVNMHATQHLRNDIDIVHLRTADSIPYTDIEGFNLKEVDLNKQVHPVRVYSEYGNAFVVYNKLTHTKISMQSLVLWMYGTIFLLSLLFYRKTRKWYPRDPRILLMGFLLYMLVEIFSPVHRPQYNTVQWLPLLLTALLLIRPVKSISFFLIVLGLLLNISNFSWLPLRHTVGEYIWFLAIGGIIFHFSSNEKAPSFEGAM